MLKSFFSWLASLFKKPTSVDDERYDLFRPKQRLIYHYFNGNKVVSADPMILHRKMMAKAPDLYIDSKVATFPNKDSGQAQINLTKNIREIFGVKPLDEGGLTELETAELWKSFLIYCEWVKKNWKVPPTSPTATSATIEATSAGNQPTSNTSASGSIASEQNTAEPCPSSSEQASHSAQSIPETSSSPTSPTVQEKLP